MFISSGFLAIQYGVDDKIAKFYADREPPKDNLYWKDKLLYLRPEPGWLFIPLIADLLYKCGVEREQLISDNYVDLMESIGHISALEEAGEYTHQQVLSACIELVKDKYESEVYYNNLLDFMQGGNDNPFSEQATPFKALHRGDYFLFSLCALRFKDELQLTLVKYWFALISTLLLLDDADDLSNDEKSGDPNAFLESGLDKEGISRIVNLVKSNLQQIAQLNKSMAAKLDQSFISLDKLPNIHQLLNQ